MTSCKHYNAFPTIYHASHAGYLWCPDCGAIRGISTLPGVKPNKHWLRPNGKTVSEHVGPMVDDAYQTGQMRPLLPFAER